MGIFFAILSPAIFGVTNYVDKFLLEKENISPIFITIFGGIFAFVTGLIILLVTGFYPIDLKTFIIILASGYLTSIYLLPYYKALSLDDTSTVIPLLQSYPVFVLILGYLLLGESLTMKGYIGSLLIIIASFALALEKLKWGIFKFRKSFFFIMLSSFLFALAQVLYKFGVTEIPFWNTLPYEGFGIALGALSVLFYKNNFRKVKKETTKLKKRAYSFIGLNEVIYIFARYTGYFAISLISVGLVSVLAGFQSLFGLIYGIILSIKFPYVLKEIITKKTIGLKITSIILMIAGAYFIFS